MTGADSDFTARLLPAVTPVYVTDAVSDVRDRLDVSPSLWEQRIN